MDAQSSHFTLALDRRLFSAAPQRLVSGWVLMLALVAVIGPHPARGESPAKASSTGPGQITATIQTAANSTTNGKVKKVQPIDPAQITAIKAVGRKISPAGMKTTVTNGRVHDNHLMVSNLDPSASYDLRIELKSGKVIQGWNAHVPDSDYVKKWPLGEKAKAIIFKHMNDEDFSAFYDRIRVLDVAGNGQYAAVLVERIRRRPFVGGHYKKGEWVWRVDRFQWESPKQGQWVPWQEMPFYALVRKRLFKKGYEKKSVVYARSLGGIKLTDKSPHTDLGKIVIPKPTEGVYAIRSTGQTIKPQTIKAKP